MRRAWRNPSARNKFSNSISTASIWARRAYGVDGAAHVYFGVSARDLTLAQAAMLATLTRAPSVFSPRRDLLAAQQRASLVLDAMVETGAITQAAADDARAHPAVVIDRTKLDARNYFLDTAADEAKALAAQAGASPNADLIVHTTLEPKLQEGARLAVARVIGRYGKRDRVHEAAVVMMKPDGAVAALLGGVDYQSSVYQPRGAGASPARLGLQALRLSHRAGIRHLALGRAR